MDISVLDIAFIVAVVAFFKEQFGFEQKSALFAAFVVSLIVGLAPQLANVFPALAEWINSALRVVVLFLSAAGSWDAVKSLTHRG